MKTTTLEHGGRSESLRLKIHTGEVGNRDISVPSTIRVTGVEHARVLT
jgi:hypothetical protein